MALVQTVLGPVPSEELGRILPHEHVIGAYGRGLPRDFRFESLPQELILQQHLPLVRDLIGKYDCRTLVEVSPWGLRSAADLETCAELSRQTGVNIVAATGYYYSARRPPNFHELETAELAEGMIREISEGIEGTGVRAGIIKIAVSDMGPDDIKVCKAAALAQRESGLSITTHAGSPEARRSILDLLEGAGVDPSRICLGHADANATLIEILSLLRRGCNVLFTIWGIQNPRLIGWGLPVLPKYHSAGLSAGIVAEGYGGQLLASIDYAAGLESPYYEVEGRDYRYMFTHVVDALRMFGVSDSDIERMLRDNPRRMLEPVGSRP